MELAFINFSDPKEIRTKDARKMIRSLAMQRYHIRQRLDVQKSHPEKSSPLLEQGHRIQPKKIQGHSPGVDEDSTMQDMGYADVARIQRKEELSGYPISPTERYTFTIFHHYGAAVAGGLLPLGKFLPTNPLRTTVLPLVNQDAALFHIILANAGMDMMTWRGEQFFDPLNRSYIRGRENGNVFCMKHKMEGIRIINGRLNDPMLSISDETILAVSHLANYEMLVSATEKPEDRFQEFKVHMDGIEQMVKLRGGLKAIGLNTCLTQLILRVDHLYSALTGNLPRFTIKDTSEESLNSLPGFSPYQSPDIVSGIVNPGLQMVLYQLYNASQILEGLQDPVAESVFFSFGIKRALVEESLFRLGEVDGLPQVFLTPIEQCCRFAALLYVQTALAKVNCKVYKSLVVKLRHSIEQVGAEALNMINSNLLLWMLLVGGGAAPYNLDRIWFIKSIEIILQTPLWIEVEQRLQGWPWRPKYCVPWRAVWWDAVKSAMINKKRDFIIVDNL